MEVEPSARRLRGSGERQELSHVDHVGHHDDVGSPAIEGFDGSGEGDSGVAHPPFPPAPGKADPAWGARYSQERVAGGDETDLLEITCYQPEKRLEIKGVINEGHVAYRHQLVRLISRSTRLRTRVEPVTSEPVARTDLDAARLVAAVSANLETLQSRLANRTSVRLTSRSRRP